MNKIKQKIKSMVQGSTTVEGLHKQAEGIIEVFTSTINKLLDNNDKLESLVQKSNQEIDKHQNIVSSASKRALMNSAIISKLEDIFK